MKVIKYRDNGYGIGYVLDFINSYRTDVKFVPDKKDFDVFFGAYNYIKFVHPVLCIYYYDESYTIAGVKNVINSVYDSCYENFIQINLEFIRPIISVLNNQGKDFLFNLHRKDLNIDSSSHSQIKFGCSFYGADRKYRNDFNLFCRDLNYGIDNLVGIKSKNTLKYYNRLNEKIELASPYKFIFCFENSIAPNYNTEKLSEASLTRAIPVYWGSDSEFVKSIINQNSYIHLKENDSFETHLKCVLEVYQNQDLYDEYLNQKIFLDLDLMYDQLDHLVDFIKEQIF